MGKYIWFSGATDVTGQALADALNITGTKTKPRDLNQGDIVIGWGTKTDAPINIPNAVVLNHPDKIRTNRNKLATLQTLLADRHTKEAIAPFISGDNVVGELSKRRPSVKFPLVGRTNFHQGGKGFWLCLNIQHIQRAISDGAQYFQNFIDIKEEYRLHVAFGSVIYAVKKVENASEAGWTAQRKEKILDHAGKNNRNLDESTLDYVLGRMVKEAALPDRIIRSNKKGWKFSGVRLDNVTSALKDVAIMSVGTIGLDFGAVDCAIGLDDKPYLIEINSGPGLQGTALQKYVDAFQARIAEMEAPVAAAARPARQRRRASVGAANAEAGPAPRGMARIMQNVQNDDEARAVIEALMREED